MRPPRCMNQRETRSERWRKGLCTQWDRNGGSRLTHGRESGRAIDGGRQWRRRGRTPISLSLLDGLLWELTGFTAHPSRGSASSLGCGVVAGRRGQAWSGNGGAALGPCVERGGERGRSGGFCGRAEELPLWPAGRAGADTGHRGGVHAAGCVGRDREQGERVQRERELRERRVIGGTRGSFSFFRFFSSTCSKIELNYFCAGKNHAKFHGHSLTCVKSIWPGCRSKFNCFEFENYFNVAKI